MAREFDIVLFGATGYTGKVVAEYFLNLYGPRTDLKWAIAGRDAEKLARVRAEIGAHDLPVVIADCFDPTSLSALAKRTRVVATTVGPYRLYGGNLVAVCASEGTDYVDITGESEWMRDMLAHDAEAKASGARIVFCCGFDSIPFDLGVHFLQRAAQEKFGAAAPRVRGRVRQLYRGVRGGMSGGSLATMMALFMKMQKDPQLVAMMRDPFLLTPEFRGPEQPDGNTPYEDRVAGSWVEPFMMAAVNTKIVHRSNFLLGHPWGKDFRYDEMAMRDGPPPAGAAPPNPFADPNRPKPGEGPSKADREGGCYELLFIAEMHDGRTLRTNVRSEYDASADSTARLLAESAVCLARDISRESVAGGMWTPASAMAEPLMRRLEANAGMSFRLEE